METDITVSHPPGPPRFRRREPATPCPRIGLAWDWSRSAFGLAKNSFPDRAGAAAVAVSATFRVRLSCPVTLFVFTIVFPLLVFPLSSFRLGLSRPILWRNGLPLNLLRRGQQKPGRGTTTLIAAHATSHRRCPDPHLRLPWLRFEISNRQRDRSR